MTIVWRSLVVALVLSASSLAQISTAATGSVEGVVLDGDGRPLPGATVFIGTLAKGPRANSDADGRFLVREVPIGRVGLNAYKESDGYPYNMFSFFIMPGEQLPKVDVVAGETAKNVVIHLGAKAAYLRLEVADKNGLPINASLSFSRPDLGQYGDYHRSVNANALILVPPVPFRLTVEAKGFHAWHYGSERSQDKEGLIVLKSGETLGLAIQLKRLE